MDVNLANNHHNQIHMNVNHANNNQNQIDVNFNHVNTNRNQFYMNANHNASNRHQLVGKMLPINDRYSSQHNPNRNVRVRTLAEI